MGAWGPGVFQNDHALDLLSLEVAHLVSELETVLAIEDLAFDDLEGPLIYVHLLARIAEEADCGLSPAVVSRWRTTYLAAFDGTIGGKSAYITQRRALIAHTFDRLLPKPAAKKPVAKKPAAKKQVTRKGTSR